jgi:DNA replication and repair protein RecF
VHLSVLAAENFRNLEPFRVELGERFNLFEGRNGQGKTNLLEAVVLLSTFRSARDAKNPELIRFGADRATVFGEVLRKDIGRTVELELTREGKKVTLDGKSITRLPTSFAHLNAVTFGPDDLELTKGAPEVRRRFLDRATYAVWPEHLLEMRAYQEALKHRNRLLRDAKVHHQPVDIPLIEAFEAELARRGAAIEQRRHHFLEGFRPRFEAAFSAITEGELRGAILHETSGLEAAHFPLAELVTRLTEKLASARQNDLRLGYTRVGPHADDLDFQIDGKAARIYASQGQHRAFVLALKIAELERIEDALGVFPVFLLDDVSSELDERRNGLLMKRLELGGGQVFITTTDRRWIRVGEARHWKVEEGRILAQ